MSSLMNEKASQLALDPERLQRALGLLDQAVADGITPGAEVVVARNGQTLKYACGTAEADTIFDCASLTKVVATLPLVLMLLEEGRLRLDDPVALFLPAFAVNGKSAVTIRHLLTHTSGLISFTDMHSHGWSRDEIIRFVLEQELQHEPGSRVVYSDMGYIVLGHLISELWGEPLDQAADRRLFQPLNMRDTWFRLPAGLPLDRVAPTEQYAGEEGPRQGEVHDENAYALGGISGHAGLFSTAQDLTRYAELWLGEGRCAGGRLLSSSAVRLAVRLQSGEASGGRRGLGWALKGDSLDASGDLLSAHSYGHTGFTGTSLFIDPACGVSVALLTNRVRYGRQTSVVRLRALFHNAIAASITDM
ncbi:MULTISPECIES: serine hydrolase [unclassified Paenibacillus]|uniref:serine hydrolase domain-containing protein n=1 Tax=unclassified Paenibacillus TaxID=185978 RepID=UPI00210E5058|nr:MULTISPECIES: serine hydrolase domain-containing protein [unclassified Paenibacillus]